MILAEIMQGERATADVFFMLAVIAFGLATIIRAVTLRPTTVARAGYAVIDGVLVALGLAFVAFAWMAL